MDRRPSLLKVLATICSPWPDHAAIVHICAGSPTLQPLFLSLIRLLSRHALPDEPVDARNKPLRHTGCGAAVAPARFVRDHDRSSYPGGLHRLILRPPILKGIPLKAEKSGPARSIRLARRKGALLLTRRIHFNSRESHTFRSDSSRDSTLG